jgi:multidrug transporter EmrE-like cation transporter
MKAWLYIVIAVVLQTLWGLVLKILDFGKAWEFIQKGEVFNMDFLMQLLPVLAYLILGLLIAIVLSKAYKLMPLSVVYAAWMGLTLILQLIVDILFFSVNMHLLNYLYFLFVLTGILGMKLSNPKLIKLKKT